MEKFGWQFRLRDKVIQTQNNYDKEVFNGDLGFVERIDHEESELTVRFEGRTVTYAFGELDELAPAYAITIHKSQGSEFPVVVIPLAMSQFILLQRNLLYTGITRGRRLVVLVGQRKALACAVSRQTPASVTAAYWRGFWGKAGMGTRPPRGLLARLATASNAAAATIPPLSVLVPGTGGGSVTACTRAASAMNSLTRSSSISLAQWPFLLKCDPTMSPSDAINNSPTFSIDTPEPTKTGNWQRLRASATSNALGGLPVLVPVTMMVSAPMNSAASAMSPSERSAVQACEECFFLMSAQTCTSVAPIIRR